MLKVTTNACILIVKADPADIVDLKVNLKLRLGNLLAALNDNIEQRLLAIPLESWLIRPSKLVQNGYCMQDRCGSGPFYSIVALLWKNAALSSETCLQITTSKL